MLMMAVVVSLLATSSDLPQVRVTPVGYMTIEACQQWQASMASAGSSLIDPISDKRLEGTMYQCIPVDGKTQMDEIQQALRVGR